MATSEQKAISRWGGWARRLAAISFVGLALLVGALAFVLGSLDAPWLKQRLQARVHDAANLDVDWRQASVSVFSGLTLEDVRVQSPVELRGSAPDFIQLARLEATWSVQRLLRGDGPMLDTVHLKGLKASIVDDAQRGTTFSLLWPPDASSAPTSGPGLSRVLSDLFSKRAFVGQAQLDDASLIWSKVDQGAVVDEAAVEGLHLRLDGWRVHLDHGDTPLRVRAQGHHATVKLDLDADPSSAGAALSLAAIVESQDFRPELPVGELVKLDARAEFDVKASQVRLAVSTARLLDGAVVATAALTRGDDGGLTVREATADADLVHAAKDATALGVPLSVGKGSLAVRVVDLRVLPRLALGPGGTASVKAALADLVAAQGQASNARVELQLTHAQGATPTLAFTVVAAHLVHAPAALTSLQVDGAATQDPEGWSGNAKVRAKGLVATPQARVADVDLVLRAAALTTTPAGALLPVAGRFEVTGTAGGALFNTSAMLAELGDVHLDLKAKTDGHPPFAASAELEGHVRLAPPRGTAWLDDTTSLSLQASQLDLEALTGVVEARLGLGARSHAVDHGPAGPAPAALEGIALQLTAKKATASTAQVDATLEAKTLAAVTPLLGLPAGWRVDWARATASLTTRLELANLDAALPRVTHATTLEVKGLAGVTPRGAVAAPSLRVMLDAKGTAQAHAGTLTLTCSACTLGAASLGGEEKLLATFDVDRPTPHLTVQLDARGDGPTVQGLVSAGYLKRDDRTELTAQLMATKLGALAPLLAETGARPLDLARLGLKLSARGSAPGTSPALEAAEGSAEADLTQVAWAATDQSLEVPSLAVSVKVTPTDAGTQLTATAKAAQLELAVAEHTATLSDLALSLDGALTRGSPLASGTVDVAVREVSQDFAPAYAVAGVHLHATGGRGVDGLLTLAKSTLTNDAAGTSLWVEGALAPDPTHPKAMVIVELRQDLSKAWREPKQFQGTGAAVLRLSLHSADLRSFQTTGSLAVAGADVRVPGAFAEGVQGELPFAVDFVRDDRGLRPVRTARVNPYALLRFQDQHPLLKAQSFLTVRKLTTPQVIIAPLAANVQLAQSVLYMSQLELGVQGGVVTGELLVDMNEKDPRVRANVRATGVRSEGGDTFSGNAALAISLRDHSVDGRAEVLEISKRQLLALLDLQDPHRTSSSSNRIRQVLELGYPERLHILFNHGFASAKVTFGGAASLVQLDELRGIPVESLLDRYLFNADTPEGT